MSRRQKGPHPPRMANQLLEWIYRGRLLEEVQGDLYELFNKRVQEKGIGYAQRMYWVDVVRFSLPSTKKRKNPLLPSSSSMFTSLPSSLKIACRHLLKHKITTLINLIGLTMGVVCFLLASLYVHYHTHFDTYHQEAHSLYRVEVNEWAGAPFGMASLLQDSYPDLKQVSRLFLPLQGPLLRYEDKTFVEKKFLYADSTFFDLFTFEFVKGNPSRALTQPGMVVISQRMAEKYFGKQNPLQKTIHLLANGKAFPYLVTGVFRDIAPQTHFSADFIASISTLTVPDRIIWTDYIYHTYVKLPSTESIDQMALQLSNQISGLQPTPLHTEKIQVSFRPVVDIHLYSHKERELGANASITPIYIVSLAALFVLLMGCINFMNMSTAASLYRAKEVGLRKAIGAFRSQLIGQFLAESFLVVFLSVLAGSLITALLTKSFASFTGFPIDQMWVGFKTIWYSIPITLVVATLFSGLYPAFYISRYSATALLKKQIELSTSFGSYTRKGLMVLQLVIAFCLISGALVVNSQLGYIQEASLGFSKEQILLLPTSGEVKKAYPTFKKELLAHTSIRQVTASYSVPGQRIIVEKFALAPNLDQTHDLRVVVSDFDFIETYDLELLQGRSFSKQIYADSLGAFVINQKAATYFGWEEPLGQKIHFPLLGTTGEVIGVVKDFNYASLHSAIEPLLLYVSPNRQTYSYVSVKFKGNQAGKALKAIEHSYKALFPNLPFEYEFLDENFKSLYEQEERLQRIVEIFSLFSITLSCFGLLGLVNYTLEQKRKEIAVRKVVGATILGLVLRFFKHYAILLLIAFLFSVPIAHYLLKEWLSGFAYQVSLDGSFFILSGLLVTLVTFLTVSYSIIKAAMVKPTVWLREG